MPLIEPGCPLYSKCEIDKYTKQQPKASHSMSSILGYSFRKLMFQKENNITCHVKLIIIQAIYINQRIYLSVSQSAIGVNQSVSHSKNLAVKRITNHANMLFMVCGTGGQ